MEKLFQDTRTDEMGDERMKITIMKKREKK
jgi:hypothetical protein